MSRNVCVLSQAEAESLYRGEIPDCKNHSHMRKRKAKAMAEATPKDPNPPFRWVGKNRVVRLAGQRTWRVTPTADGFWQLQFVP
jgi:hypothetical protein